MQIVTECPGDAAQRGHCRIERLTGFEPRQNADIDTRLLGKLLNAQFLGFSLAPNSCNQGEYVSRVFTRHGIGRDIANRILAMHLSNAPLLRPLLGCANYGNLGRFTHEWYRSQIGSGTSYAVIGRTMRGSWRFSTS